MEYFVKYLGLSVSEDIRGILWIPEEHRGEQVSMDHVAVAVAFNGFMGHVCSMHTVISRPDLLSRHMIRESFDYIFNTCDVKFVFGPVDSTNKAAIEFDTRLGFKELYRIEGGGVDGDLIIFGMAKQDCRWIKGKKHGIEKRAESA